MKLKLYMKKVRYSGYGDQLKYIKNIKNEALFLSLLKDQYLSWEFTISTVTGMFTIPVFAIPSHMEGSMRGVISSKIGFRKWVMVLDCDSINNRDEAIIELQDNGIRYRIIESSPNKFWIITNFVGTVKNCCDKMGTIPGVDREYLASCRNQKLIAVRAFPKAGFVPVEVFGLSSRMNEVAISIISPSGWLDFFNKLVSWFSKPDFMWLVNKQNSLLNRAQSLQNAYDDMNFGYSGYPGLVHTDKTTVVEITEIEKEKHAQRKFRFDEKN